MTFKSVNFSKRIDVIALIENRGGLCSEYASLFVSLCISIGINGRRIGLFFGEEGHQITEIYINGKWQVFDPLYHYYFNKTTQEIVHNYNITERQILFNNTYDNVQTKNGFPRITYIYLADYYSSFHLIIESPSIFNNVNPGISQIYNDGQNPLLLIFTDIDWYE